MHQHQRNEKFAAVAELADRTGNTGAESCRLRQIVERGGRVGKVTSPESWRALARATGGSIPSPSAKFAPARRGRK